VAIGGGCGQHAHHAFTEACRADAQRFPRLRRLFADQAYQGEFVDLVQCSWNLDVEIVRKPQSHTGFVALPRRWVVERSIAWTSRHRRLAKDDERLPESTEAFVYLAFIHLMLQRLCPDPSRCQPYQWRPRRAVAASVLVGPFIRCRIAPDLLTPPKSVFGKYSYT